MLLRKFKCVKPGMRGGKIRCCPCHHIAFLTPGANGSGKSDASLARNITGAYLQQYRLLLFLQRPIFYLFFKWSNVGLCVRFVGTDKMSMAWIPQKKKRHYTCDSNSSRSEVKGKCACVRNSWWAKLVNHRFQSTGYACVRRSCFDRLYEPYILHVFLPLDRHAIYELLWVYYCDRELND